VHSPDTGAGRAGAVSRRQALRLFGGAGLAAGSLALGGCTITKGTAPISTQGLSKDPAPGRKTNIEVYSIFGGTVGQGWVKLASRYEQVQKDVGVRVTYAPGTSSGEQQKLLVAIAANSPPDVAQLIPFETPQWADLGIMKDLTPYFERDGLSEKDFIKTAWKGMSYRGRVWQLQWDADPNFPFFWNKDLFEKSGLDPDKPPRTIDEVDEFSKKINQANGRNVTTIGMVPWTTYGYANSIFTWGFAFGGSFYDADTNKLTPDHEYVVAALEWMVRYAKSVGGAGRVTVAPPSLQINPFGAGNIGMAPLVSADLAAIKAAEPKMKIGAGLLPYQPPGGTRPGQGAWIGGWSAFVPSKAKHPDEAWDFIRWMSAEKDGTEASWKNVGFPPTLLESPALQEIKHDPLMAPYYDTLFATDNARPAVPVSDFLAQQFETYVSKAVYGQMTPLAALRAVKANTEKEWARFTREVGV
jgi:multiple sugar transport system substrate-binding protein